jgi:hypothetical protein
LRDSEFSSSVQGVGGISIARGLLRDGHDVTVLLTIDLTAIVDRLSGPVRQVPRRVLLGRLLSGFS